MSKPRAYTENPSIGTTNIDSSSPGKSSAQDLLLKNVVRKERITTVCVNSRNRNILTYPNTNLFRWRFKRPMKDILSIRLIGGAVPSKIYNITSSWNKFTILEASTKYTVLLTPGFYDTTAIATELARALNAVIGIVNTYSVSYSTSTLKLTISRTSGSSTFSFLFKSGQYIDSFDVFSGQIDSMNKDYLTMINSPARLLGFLSLDYASSSGIIISENVVDIGWFLNKIYLHINADTNNELNRIEHINGSHDPYTIIYLDSELNGIKFLNKETDYPIIVFEPAPIARLISLDISLRDEFYRVLDIGNREFSLLFEILFLE